MILSSEISKESSTRTLSGIISNIKQPKPDDEGDDRHRSFAFSAVDFIPEEIPDISGKANNYDGGDDHDRPSEDKGAAATEAAGGAITDVAHQGLDEETGDWTAEPYDAGEGVGDAELLDVRGKERELEGPPELYATGY